MGKKKDLSADEKHAMVQYLAIGMKTLDISRKKRLLYCEKICV